MAQMLSDAETVLRLVKNYFLVAALAQEGELENAELKKSVATLITEKESLRVQLETMEKACRAATIAKDDMI